MSQEPNPEDPTILAAIASLEQGADPIAPSGPRGDETAETLARLYTEVLGLIPSELEPVAPSPGARERLLAALGTAPGVRAGDSRPVPVASPSPVPAPIASAPEPAPPAPRLAPGPLPRRRSRWPLALAAALALAFAGTSAWLWQIRQQQSAEIAALRQELAAQRQIATKAGLDGQQARTEMERMRSQFALVTSPAVEVRPLRPAGGLQPNARGMLFVAPDHQHWYLSLEGLQPAPEGEIYKLWWVLEQGAPIDAGSLVAQNGVKIQMASDQMPAGIADVVVTLEPTPSSPTPLGPAVLKAGP